MASTLTMKQLDEMTSRELIIHCIRERKTRCTNVYSPLYRRLTDLIREVEKSSVFGESLKSVREGKVEMSTRTKNPQGSGWAFIIGHGRKAHYFLNGRSLCGDYGSFGRDFENNKHESPDNCAKCKKKHKKRYPELYLIRNPTTS